MGGLGDGRVWPMIKRLLLMLLVATATKTVSDAVEGPAYRAPCFFWRTLLA